MKITASLLLFFISLHLFGQINSNDSTVQVIGYWDKNEKQSFRVTFDKYQVKAGDTTNREKYTYDVEITILDSTSKSYTIQWLYKNYQVQTGNELTKKIMSLAEDCKVIITTDELGAFVEVANWKDVRDYMNNAIKKVKAQFKNVPNIDNIFGQIQKVYTSKEAIETVAIKDIHQFYTFHGAKYKLGQELNNRIKLPNLLGGDPFDTDITVILDDINFEGDNSVLRMWQTTDSAQLTEATYNYLKRMALDMKVALPKREDIKTITNKTSMGSRIHGSTGWVTYSFETKETSTDGIVNVEERVIELR
ncbi:MAG TPA: hypothetical protein VHO90_00455 [Bacteroidales bacterium]|nr:hypothetical protein [Bacteroidales bacterium]